MAAEAAAVAKANRRGRSRTRRSWFATPLSVAAPERGTLADRCADAIRLRILMGKVAPGRRLESMRQLSAELDVSLAVVREVIARLQGEGLVRVRHGVGTFVERRQSGARSLRAARRRATRREAAELRQSVDPAVARAAAGRASPEGVAEMHFALLDRQLSMAGGDPANFTDADVAFHLAVAKAAGNGLGIGIHRLGARVLRPDLISRAVEHARNHELAELHRALFEAIEQQRPGRAERAARAIAAIEARPP